MLKKVFFSKKTGLEVSLGKTAQNNSGYVTGRVYLRAFPLEKGGRERQIIVKLQPEEAYSIALNIPGVIRDKKGKQALVHKFQAEEVEYTTTVSLDAWKSEKTGKSGYGVTVSRSNGNEDDRLNIAVPLSGLSFRFLAHILKTWAVDSCFEEKIEVVDRLPDDMPRDSEAVEEAEAIDDLDDEDIPEDIPF